MSAPINSDVHVLTLSCRDKPGITARVTSYLFEKGGNVLEAQQYYDLEGGDWETLLASIRSMSALRYSS